MSKKNALAFLTLLSETPELRERLSSVSKFAKNEGFKFTDEEFAAVSQDLIGEARTSLERSASVRNELSVVVNFEGTPIDVGALRGVEAFRAKCW